MFPKKLLVPLGLLLLVDFDSTHLSFFPLAPNDEEPPAKPAWDQKKKTSGWDDAWGADKDWYGGEWGAGNWGGGEDWNDWSYGTTDYKRSAKGAGRDQQRDSKGTRGKHGTAAGERDNGTDKSPRSGEKEQKGEQAGSRYDQEKGGSVRQRPERKTAANGASPGEGGAKKASPEHAKGPRKVEYKVGLFGEEKLLLSLFCRRRWSCSSRLVFQATGSFLGYFILYPHFEKFIVFLLGWSLVGRGV